MIAHRPVYISCSRRTDIPRFFADEFFAAWHKGEITYNAGYGRNCTLSLKPQIVLGYVFWSKDFSRFVAHPSFKKLIDQSNAIFHYTINNCPDLEPNVAPLADRLKTLFRLCEMVGPQRVLWRFDPICKYRVDNGRFVTNFESFFDILSKVKESGVSRCYFSFMTHYAKLKNRDVIFRAFEDDEKSEMAGRLFDATSRAGITLYNCCNADVLRRVPGIRQAHCIDDDILRETDRFGMHPRLPLKPTREECGCYESRDIGSYLQRCGHRCRYCYANPG